MKTLLPALLEVLSLVSFLFITPMADAHCDTLDGPVVEVAKQALEKGDVTPILKWVNKESETELREAFAVAVKVRILGEDARKLADTHLFETLVRLHRAGEGVPFTGLKPVGTIDPGFVAADKALQDEKIADLSESMARSITEGLHKRFAKVTEKTKNADKSVEAGRAYVAAYVEYVHYVEAIHRITSVAAEEHHQHLHAPTESSK